MDFLPEEGREQNSATRRMNIGVMSVRATGARLQVRVCVVPWLLGCPGLWEEAEPGEKTPPKHGHQESSWCAALVLTAALPHHANVDINPTVV